jgi:tripartite-type tricarboxylate transporter receptor subunit TctC
VTAALPIRPQHLLLSVLAVFLLPFTAGAQDYPNKPIKMIIPWAAGGPTDSIGRVLTQKMAEQMGQSFVIENKPGATGTIGHAIAARAAPDGYTVLLASNSTFSIAPHLYKDLAYDNATAFAPVAWVALNAQVLSVHPSLPAKSYAELVALAKAEPGKLNFSTAGVGSTSHLATELLMSMAGIKLTHVPYKGGEPSLQALLAGETKVAFVDLSIAGAQAAAGRLRPLAVSTPSRAASPSCGGGSRLPICPRPCWRASWPRCRPTSSSAARSSPGRTSPVCRRSWKTTRGPHGWAKSRRHQRRPRPCSRPWKA